MSAVLLSYCNPLAIRREHVQRDMAFVTIGNGGGEPVIMDTALGEALGYATPLLAIDALYAEHQDDLIGLTGVVELYQPDSIGRSIVRVFDLEGAMRLCRIALTPLANQVFAKLKGIELSYAVQAFPEVQRQRVSAVILPFPINATKRMSLKS